MYAKINQGRVEKFPYTIFDLRRDHPSTSFPSEITDAELAKFGVHPVTPMEPPAVGAHEHFREVDPVLSGGVWKQTYAVETRDNVADVFATAKQDKHDKVNATRDRLQDGSVSTPFGAFNCNERSRGFILGGVVEALVRQASGDNAPLVFTTSDNRDVTLPPAQMVSAGRLILGFISAVHFHARSLKASIASVQFNPKDPAASFAALDAIDIEGGWPNGG